MRFYFDIRDGVPQRDRRGLDFQLASEAIEHAKYLAQALGKDRPKDIEHLHIAVVNENGEVIHEQAIHQPAARQ